MATKQQDTEQGRNGNEDFSLPEDEGLREIVAALRPVAQAQGREVEYDALVSRMSRVFNKRQGKHRVDSLLAVADALAPGTALRAALAGGPDTAEQYFETAPLDELTGLMFDFEAASKTMHILYEGLRETIVTRHR